MLYVRLSEAMESRGKDYFISNNALKKEFYRGMKEICGHYDIDLIQLENIQKQSGHPNTEGMENISEQIIQFLNKEYK